MKAREDFLDRLRGAATCAVVLLHTITGTMDMTDMGAYPMEKKVFSVVLDLTCWCVPIFVMISGYLFLNPERELTLGKMLAKYCRRIVLALIVFGVPYAWMEQVSVEGCFRRDMILTGFLMVLRGESWAHMWYLYLILFLYLLTPGIKWILARIPRGAVYLLLAVLFAVSSLFPYSRRLFGSAWEGMALGWGIYFFYYISGYLFVTQGLAHTQREVSASGGCRKTRGFHMKEPAALLYAMAFLLAAGMVCFRLLGGYSAQMAYNHPFTVVLSLLLFGAGMLSHGETAVSPFLRRLARYSFAVYLVHPVFLNLAYKFFRITPLDFPVGISLPVFFVVTLLLAVTAAWALNRFPPLRKYVL